MTSTLRPELVVGDEHGLSYTATYFRVLASVSRRRALAHGGLNKGPLSCAIGSYFKESKMALSAQAVNEITAYNDSFPHLCPQQRWKKVVAWLKFEVKARQGGG